MESPRPRPWLAVGCFLVASVASCSPAAPPAAAPPPAALASSSPPPSASAPAPGAPSAGPIEITVSTPDGRLLAQGSYAPVIDALTRAIGPVRTGPLGEPGWALVLLKLGPDGRAQSLSLVDSSFDAQAAAPLLQAVRGMTLAESPSFTLDATGALLVHLKLR